MGKKGATINVIAKKTGTDIQIKQKAAYIKGELDKRKMAEDEIMKIVNKVEYSFILNKTLHEHIWYRPPSSPSDLFCEFEKVIDKIDAEDLELYLLGDLNSDLMPENISNCNARVLTNILDIYGLSQLITEPTRVTPTSRTLIDVCITNCPDKIVNSGVIHVGISDHSLVYMTRKTRYERTGVHRVIETRLYNNFDKDGFLQDLAQKPWSTVSLHTNPDDMWLTWRSMFMESVDKFAPLKRKRTKHKKSPWITNDLLRQIHKRNYHKKLAVTTNDIAYWEQYKNVRNQTNNDIKAAKKRYFIDNLEVNKTNPRKTWSLINELSSRKCHTRNISEIKVNAGPNNQFCPGNGRDI